MKVFYGDSSESDPIDFTVGNPIICSSVKRFFTFALLSKNELTKFPNGTFYWEYITLLSGRTTC